MRLFVFQLLAIKVGAFSGGWLLGSDSNTLIETNVEFTLENHSVTSVFSSDVLLIADSASFWASRNGSKARR